MFINFYPFGVDFLSILLGSTLGLWSFFKNQRTRLSSYLLFFTLTPCISVLTIELLFLFPLPSFLLKQSLMLGTQILTLCFLGYCVYKKTDIRLLLDRLAKVLLFFCLAFTVLVAISIVFSIIVEACRFFKIIPPLEFFLGTSWSPQEDDMSSFGILPLFVGTFLVTLIAISVAAPLGLLSAVFLTYYASPRLRQFMKPILEMLAGVPTVIYGFFAITTVAPFIKDCCFYLGFSIAAESALVAGIVMGMMILPFISSTTENVLSALSGSLKASALALGATPAETIRHILIPAAFPGISSAFLLGISRAVGETMLVVMAAGMSANLTVNPLEPVTTVTVQIVAVLTGDQAFDSPKTLVAFALGLSLFFVTLCLNLVALRIVKKYRSLYETH